MEKKKKTPDGEVSDHTSSIDRSQKVRNKQFKLKIHYMRSIKALSVFNLLRLYKNPGFRPELERAYMLVETGTYRK